MTPTATFVPSPTPILPIFSNAVFTYDGDGKRVKSVITTNVGTTTTYFVEAHYEVADGVVTKYYYAGSQRIALRVNGTLNYLVGDHLGSTSLTTDANGQIVSELRYTAWGEVRYASGNTATKYQYTGQYTYASEFGLHYYNARWYDSSLARFAQADTVIPGGVQGYDRYAYVNNNPIRFTDPTGHKYCDAQGESDCSRYSLSIEHTALKYRIRFKGNWKDKDKIAVLEAAEATGTKFAAEMQNGETAAEAFKAIYDPITMVSVADYEYQGELYEDGCKTEGSTITCADITYGYFQSTVNNIVHEFGHVFDQGSGIPQVFIDNRETILHDNDETGMWKSNPATTPRETFGDFFVAWVFGVWGPKADDVWRGYEDVGSAKHWMTTNMSEWISP